MGGIVPASGRPFVHYETIGGGMGATADGPGLNGHRVHMGNTMNLPIEGMEASMPVRFINYEIVRDSGGLGVYPGGNGVRKTVKVLVDAVHASVLGESTKPPAGGRRSEEGRGGKE